MIPINSTSIQEHQGFSTVGRLAIGNEDEELMSLIPENLKVRFSRLLESNRLNPINAPVKAGLFFLSTCHLYSKVSLPLSERNVVVTGLVLSDGVGDYYHILNAAEWIKAKFPSVKVTMIVSHLDGALPTKVRQPLNPEIQAFFCKTQTQECPKQARFILESKPDLVIEMSVNNNMDMYLYFEVKKDKDRYRFIGEYGRSGIMQPMGLEDDHLGIIIKEKPSTSSLMDLKNEALKQVLFGTKNPAKEDLANYHKTHEPFIGYLKKGSYFQMGLIYTAAAFLKPSDKQTIDLMMPSVEMGFLDTQFLQAQGIAKIKVIRMEKGQFIEKEIILADQGKELRLISPFPLEQADLHTLFAYTNPLVGCTGDHSLSEVISFDRLPFYELRISKLSFYAKFTELAGCVGKEPHYLQRYFGELGSIYDKNLDEVVNTLEKYDRLSGEAGSLCPDFVIKVKKKQRQITASALILAELLHHPELIEELHALNELLKTQYSFNPILQNIVERQFAFNSHPDLQRAEKEIELRYLLSGFAGQPETTLAQSLEQLVKEIQNVTLKD